MPGTAALSLLEPTSGPSPTRNPNRPLSASQRVSRMRAGKRRADAQRRKQAVRRVREYSAWLQRTRSWPVARAFAAMPDLPSDRDYRIARGDV